MIELFSIHLKIFKKFYKRLWKTFLLIILLSEFSIYLILHDCKGNYVHLTLNRQVVCSFKCSLSWWVSLCIWYLFKSRVKYSEIHIKLHRSAGHVDGSSKEINEYISDFYHCLHDLFLCNDAIIRIVIKILIRFSGNNRGNEI